MGKKSGVLWLGFLLLHMDMWIYVYILYVCGAVESGLSKLFMGGAPRAASRRSTTGLLVNTDIISFRTPSKTSLKN